MRVTAHSASNSTTAGISYIAKRRVLPLDAIVRPEATILIPHAPEHTAFREYLTVNTRSHAPVSRYQDSCRVLGLYASGATASRFTIWTKVSTSNGLRK